MKFRMLIKEPVTGNSWWETQDKDTDDPVKWALDIVRWYNQTRQGIPDAQRQVMAVEVLDAHSQKEHDWYKTNLVSRSDGSDKYECSRCGVTGTRYGLGGSIVLDRKYKRPVYQRCDTAQKKLRPKEE